MITRVNSRIFTNSPYIWFSKFLTIIATIVMDIFYCYHNWILILKSWWLQKIHAIGFSMKSLTRTIAMVGLPQPLPQPPPLLQRQLQRQQPRPRRQRSEQMSASHWQIQMVNGNAQMISLEDHNVNSNVKKVTNRSTEENENANAKTTKVNSFPVGFWWLPVRLKCNLQLKCIIAC